MADTNTAEAAGERVAFTVRYDADFVTDLDERRAKLTAELGFEVSRADYLKYACRQLWDQDGSDGRGKTS